MIHFENNLEFLKKRFPLLFQMLQTDEYDSSMFTIEKSKSGDPTLQIKGNYIHSKFDPRREAERFVSTELSDEAGLIIFAGMGLGYHIEEFLRIDQQRHVLIVEPDRDLFLCALYHRDLTHLIDCDRVQFLIGGEPEDCIHLLENHSGKIVQLIKLRSLYAKDQIFYDRLDTFIRNYISRKEINLSTLKRFGKLWVRNLSRNAPQLARAPGINRLKGLLSSFPALLIAAGPSLDMIKPHLKELHKKFLIVAVDTSLRACLESGIEPDFTVVVDPQYWNSRHLDHCYTEKTILLSETSTYPSVFRKIHSKTFLCSSSFPLGLFLEEKTELKGKLKAGGSVATAAWDFCRILSINDIWCAGLDLGFPDKQTHCKGSFFEQRAHWLSARQIPSETFSWHALNDAGLKTVESNRGNMTWTDKRMSVYSRWFEEQMSAYESIRSWNLSSEGIKIQGMPGKKIEDALTKPDIRTELDFVLESIKVMEPDKTIPGKLDAAIFDLLDGLHILKGLARQGMDHTLLLKSSYSENKNVQPFLEKLSALDNEILHCVSKDIAGFILQNFITEMLRDHSTKFAADIIENSYNLYNELWQSVEFHEQLFEKSLKNLKKT